MDNIITIGKITKAQGIKGEVKIALMTDERDLYQNLTHIKLGEDSYEVETVKNLTNGVFFKLVGVDDRNSADLLRGKIVTCERVVMPELPKGRYLILDLIGCNVTINGKVFGKLTDILQNGGACPDVYCVTGEGDHSSFMFPALNKVLNNIDIIAKVIDLDSKVLEQIVVYED